MIIKWLQLIQEEKNIQMNSIAKFGAGFNLSCIQQSITYPSYDSDSYIPVFYNNYVHLIQCYTYLPEREQRIHIYNTNNKTWKAQTTSISKNGFKNNGFFPKQNCARVLIDNILYCFGGRDQKGRSDNRLSAFNLDKKIWRIDIDIASSNGVHIVPQNRVNGSLLNYKDQYLILFGGNCQPNDPITINTLWVFDLYKCCWNKIANFNIGISNPTGCIINDKIYIFGSKSLQMGHLNNLYEITIQLDPESEKMPLNFEKIEKISNPDKQQSNLFFSGSYFKLLAHYQKILFLFQFCYVAKGMQTRSSVIKLWLYDTLTQNWQKTQLEFNRQVSQIIYNEQDTFYFFDYSKKFQNMVKLLFTDNQFKKVKNMIRHKEWKKCQICYQILKNNNKLMQPAFKISKQLLQSLTQKIKFPFSAFGLLAQIAHSHSASYINFQYALYRQNPILRIQDDNHCHYTNQQFEEVIVNFAAQKNFNFGSVQRRVRGLLAKDFIKKQYGTNLKLAAMRLGTEMLYISLTPTYEARVAYFVMEQGEYVCYYYAFDEKTNKIVDDYSYEAKLYVQSKYRDLIFETLHQIPVTIKYAQYKNTLIILGLKKIVNEFGEEVPELQPYFHHQHKDILYIPNQMVYKKYLEYGCKINQAIDVSLATYLSMLFLKNQHMKMTIQLHEAEKRVIKRQELLQIVDRSSFNKVVSSVGFLLKNFDLKTMELLFNNKLSKKLGIFHNGVLIYHKNRLIKRFGWEFGTLLQKMQETDRLSFGYFNVFGRIELPDSLEPNQQKTDFVNHNMLQKINSRLRFIHQLLWKNLDNQKDDGKPSKQGPKLRSRIGQDYQLKQQPAKKVKRSQEDQSYNAN